ncbi:MAG: DUF2071 domain-containing protein [Gemmataceae bacterium]|nr:DUF2071 domain-containing protein [Gemmataceae bacterium]
MKSRQFLTCQWRDLVMLNYPVEPVLLRSLVPAGTRLDLFQGVCYVSLVGFHYQQTRLMGMAIPFHRNFPEVNLRFYVVREDAGEIRRGVVFIKEVVPLPAVAAVARWFFHEKFTSRPMKHEVRLPSAEQPGLAKYQWKHKGNWFQVQAEFEGESALAKAGSLEEFITEHYWGYTSRPDGSTLEYRVEHPSWQVWPKAEGSFTSAGEFYPDPWGEILQSPPASCLVAAGSEITVYRGGRIKNRLPLPRLEPISH